MSHFIYYFRPSQSEVDDDMMRQRFVDEFRIYEDKLFRISERDNIHRYRVNDTLGHLYARVVECMCTTVVMCMTPFHAQEIAEDTTTTTKSTRQRTTGQQKIPLSTVHALYKMMEYYVPVYDAVSYDVDLLCTVCKL